MVKIKWRIKGQGGKKPVHCMEGKVEEVGREGYWKTSPEEKKTRADKINEKLEQWGTRLRANTLNLG